MANYSQAFSAQSIADLDSDINDFLTANPGITVTSITNTVSGAGFYAIVSWHDGAAVPIDTISGDTGFIEGATVKIGGGTTGLTTTGDDVSTMTLGGMLNVGHGGTGIANANGSINLGSPTLGYVLTSDAGGNATWQASSSSVLQNNIFYVAKSGNNTNNGRNIENAVLTFGHAMTLAAAQTPTASNRFAIWCFDDGIYTEDIVGISYVDIFAPNATITATTTGLTVADLSHYKFLALNVPTAAIGVKKLNTDVTTSWIDIDVITCAGTAVGISNLATAGVLMAEWETMYVADGVGIGSTATATGHTHMKGGDIYLTSAAGTGTGVLKVGAGSFVGTIDHILLQGAGAGTAIKMVQGLIDVTVSTIVATTAFNLNGIIGSTILNLICLDITGTQTVTNGAIYNSYVYTLNGDFGSATGNAITIKTNTPMGCGGSVVIYGSGSQLLFTMTDGASNTLLGGNAGYLIAGGNLNTAIGSSALSDVEIGGSNVALGASALQSIDTGSNNIGIGTSSGTLYHSVESSNIVIGNVGVTSENNVIRIGTQGSSAGQQSTCYIAGITGVTTANSNMVTINTATGQLGAAALPLSTQTIAGTSGTATGTSITITSAAAAAGKSVTFNASGSTVTLHLSDTNSNLFLGAGSGALAPSGSYNSGLGVDTFENLSTGSNNTAAGWDCLGNITTGASNIGLGYSAGSNYTTSESSNIVIGNTGTLAESNVIRIGTQGASAGQQNTCYIAGINGVAVGSPNFVTIDTTSGQLGTTTTTPSGINTLNGSTGSATGSTVTLDTKSNCGLTCTTTGAGATITFKNTDASSNIFMGSFSGNTGYTGNTNVGLGSGTFNKVTSASSNTCIGNTSGHALTTGSANTAVGNTSLYQLTTGSSNVAIGSIAGLSYTSSESSNILILNQGTMGESNVVRIGAQGSSSGQQNNCYIAGITGVTIAGGAAVLCDSTGHLGTVVSSRRYKENIIDMGDTSCIYSLEPRTFDYIADPTEELHYGLIAEEVALIMPSIVVNDDQGRPDSVKYHELAAILLNELQKLEQRVAALENK